MEKRKSVLADGGLYQFLSYLTLCFSLLTCILRLSSSHMTHFLRAGEQSIYSLLCIHAYIQIKSAGSSKFVYKSFIEKEPLLRVHKRRVCRKSNAPRCRSFTAVKRGRQLFFALKENTHTKGLALSSAFQTFFWNSEEV
jgi:hypothetical protein